MGARILEDAGFDGIRFEDVHEPLSPSGEPDTEPPRGRGAKESWSSSTGCRGEGIPGVCVGVEIVPPSERTERVWRATTCATV
jgi:hypothetical protein